MNIQCDNCEEVIVEPGALIFSPPDKENKCKKLHICIACWKEFIQFNDSEDLKGVEDGK